MRVRGRQALAVVGMVTIVCGGWAAGRVTDARAVAHAEVLSVAPGGAPPLGPASCIDRVAMEANANLVGQVHDYRARLTLAEQRARRAEVDRAKVVDAAPDRLVPPPAEWARMARERTIRVRVPCSHPGASGTFVVHDANGGITMRPGIAVDVGPRAKAAGLSPEERSELAEAYTRAHAQTWAAMRSTCEANEAFRAALEELGEEEITDEQRIDRCSSTVLDAEEPSRREALMRAAELQAAGAGIDRTTTSEQRVAFALMSAPATLFDEMVRAIGREKVTRAVDNGLFCLDETVFDLRETDGDDG